ncbi:MAG: hypothetical protein LBT00_15980 [Spirochaetaceae bacterium]|jgi:hypothetical protein|nr:hypothetical protein [Spirochaetaceae bacterium]
MGPVQGQGLGKQFPTASDVCLTDNYHKGLFNCVSAYFFYFLQNNHRFDQNGIGSVSIFTGGNKVIHDDRLLRHITQNPA